MVGIRIRITVATLIKLGNPPSFIRAPLDFGRRAIVKPISELCQFFELET
jgi:hypothetical protein